MAQIRSKPFGVTKEGANVTEYTLSNPGGLSVSVLDYGCCLLYTSCWVKLPSAPEKVLMSCGTLSMALM